MKITFVLRIADMSGGARVVATYADQLKKRGHQVLVVSAPEAQPTFLQRLELLVKGRRLPEAPQKKLSHVDFVDVEHHIIDRARPVVDADLPDADVVIATWWETAEWVANLSASKGAKAYFIQHYETFDYLPKKRVEATWHLPLHKIVISKWLAELATNQYGDSTISHIPNSVDTTQFNAPPRSKQSVPTIGMLYSHVYWKGCDVSLKAFALVSQQFPNLKLVTFGSYPLSENLPLPEGAEFILQPSQDTIKQIYARCDVWLCGSWSEGFHLPPLEAMACRCPVVSTQVGGPMDIIENGINGYLVPTGDAESLAAKLVDILSLSEKEWQVMSDAAYHTATSYTWEDATVLFETALLTAIERTQQGHLNSSSVVLQ